MILSLIASLRSSVQAAFMDSLAFSRRSSVQGVPCRLSKNSLDSVWPSRKWNVLTSTSVNSTGLPKVAEETVQYGQKKEQSVSEPPAAQDDTNNGVSRKEIEQLVKDFKRSCGDYHVSLKECNPEDTVVGPSVIRLKFRLGRGQSLQGSDQSPKCRVSMFPLPSSIST